MLSALWGLGAMASEFSADAVDWFTQKKKVECFLISGPNGRDVVRIQLEASIDSMNKESSLICRVLEINGEKIAKDKSGNEAPQFVFVGTTPTVEEQKNIINKALTKFGISADYHLITDGYAAGRIRVSRLRKRMEERRGGEDACV